MQAAKKKGAGSKAGSLLVRGVAPPERRTPFLPAGAGSEGDLHAPVLRLADTVGGLDQRPALAERFRGHDAVGDAAAGQVRTDVRGATLRKADVVLVRTRTVGVARDHHLGLAAGLISGSRVVEDRRSLRSDLVAVPIEEDHERTGDARRWRRDR